MLVEIIQGDITTLSVDAIVNAANRSLLGGGGVDGAIHRAAGPQLLAECKRIRRYAYPKGLPTGGAVLTNGYNLPARYVIHTVGPIYDQETNPAVLLAEAYKNSLTVAEEHELSSIAFPAISAGVCGYPKQEAAQVVKKVINEFPFRSLKKVILCYFSAEDKTLAERAFRQQYL